MIPSLDATATVLRACLPVAGDGPGSPVGSLAYVSFDGRRIWTFRVDDGHWVRETNTLLVSWPPALAPHLTGVTTAKLEIRAQAGQPASSTAEATVRFGASTEALRLRDPLTGRDLVVNKWGRLAKSFEADTETFMADVLGSAARLVAVLQDTMGLEPFVTGGTLLGLVRDGQLVAHDDDADLAYLSRHTNPTDVVLESYEMERVLAAEGFETVRHSSGHLQVMFGGTEYTDGHYVDIFSYFVTEGWFYGTFHAREKAAEVTIFPLGTVSAGGLELPAPANTDQLLTAIYGPDWRIPDPAFTFVTPEAAGRRFYWWLNHYDPFREDWEDFHRGLIGADVRLPPSALGGWLADHLAPGSTVVELGCGLGQDALALAAAGHRVLASDYSRPAIARARAVQDGAVQDGAGARPGAAADFAVANVNSVRQMAGLVKRAAALAGPDAPITVVARNLFDNLHFLGRDTALLAISHLLGRGGRAYLQMRNPHVGRTVRDKFEPAGEKIFDPWEFTNRLSFYGLEVVERNFITEPGAVGASLSYVIGKVSPS
ncbi:class I SAM-dependent methyltransferase [Specibacter sp. RAF43]|uniref:class I SAM-dependent methyltransferase n=1 Tax=Specibacter sp. RAF43 TaxID=3233057 RepID=UPI003F9E0502